MFDLSDAGWQVIGAVIVALISGPLLVLVGRREPRVANPEPSPERKVVEKAAGVNAEGMSETLVKILATAFADIENLKQERKKQGRQIAELSQVLKFFKTTIRPIIKWMDEGAKPPTPLVDEYFRELIDDVERDEP